MSTITGEAGVRPNPVPRQTRPGLRGRRLVLMCSNEHPLPWGTKQQLTPYLLRCPQCGTTGRKWVFLCAPLYLEAWEWLAFGVSGFMSLFRRRGLRR